MTGFQILISISLVLFTLGFIAVVRRQKRLLTNTSVFLIMIIVLTMIAVFIDPRLAQILADWTGIHRGADLMIYLSILFLLFISFLNFIHIRKVNNQMVELARSIALLNVQFPQDKETP